MPNLPVSHSFLTPLRFLERSAQVFPEKTAVVDGDRRYSYRELQERVHRQASALRAAGIGRGDRVAYLALNNSPLLEAHFAVPLAGGALVAINTRLNSGEIAYIGNHSGAKLLFVSQDLLPLIEPVRDRLETVQQVVTIEDSAGGGPGRAVDGPTFDEFLAAGSPEPLDWRIESEDELIAIDYTSGTTGQPKGVMYSHRGAYLNALSMALEVGYSSRTVYLWTLPMFHCNGWCNTWGVTGVGGTHICLPRVEPERVWELIESERVTHLSGAPTVLISLINATNAKPLPPGRSLNITTGGAPPSPTTIGQMESLGVELIHLYGLTECYGPYLICEPQAAWKGLPLEERAVYMARQGVPHVGADNIRIVDDNMADVPADGQTMGEVVLRGNTVMLGYFNQPEATAEAFTGGWFHTGDLGVKHPDSYVELRDRKKDIIISGGENISTIEVEQAILAHPAVLEVAVIAVPHEKWGEVPKAFVALKPGQSATADEIVQFTRGRLAHFKAPKAVEFGELPRTSTGKVQKFALRDREWQGAARIGAAGAKAPQS